VPTTRRLDSPIINNRVSGNIGEIDLGHYHGTLVFNVDIGDPDVEVGANSGELLGSATDWKLILLQP